MKELIRKERISLRGFSEIESEVKTKCLTPYVYEGTYMKLGFEIILSE